VGKAEEDMKRAIVGLLALIAAAVAFSQQPPAPGAPGAPGGRGRGGGGFFKQPDPIDFEDHTGWTSMWDGATLKEWDGDFNYWKVDNGAIVVESTCEKPTGTIYLVWKGGEAADFEMKLEMKGEGAMVNSGVQYRGAITQPRPPQAAGAGRGPGGRGRGPQGPCPSGAPRGTPPSRESQAKWDMLGAQFDFDGRNQYSGQYYEQATGRGIIAWRGQMVRTEEGKNPRLLATLGNPEELGGYVKIEGWNQLHIIARGNTMTHIINGHVMSVLIDDDATKFRKSGLIGVEIEGTGKISLRNLWLKRL
jgi:hypothetical protein